MSLAAVRTNLKGEPLNTQGKLWILREIRMIVWDDLRYAEARNDLVEVARCRAEYKEIDAEISQLTNGRGW